MRISDRERRHFRRLAAAATAHDDRSLDLFEQAERLKRRETHLQFVIRRLARRLKIDEPAELDSLGEPDLEKLRVALSKKIGESKRPALEAIAA